MFSYVSEYLESLQDEWTTDNNEVEKDISFTKMMSKKIKQLINKFEVFCSQIPVLGFNLPPSSVSYFTTRSNASIMTSEARQF